MKKQFQRKISSLLFLLITLTSSAAFAQTDIYVRGSGRLIPIALPRLCAQSEGGAAAANEIPATIQRDLDLSGFFQVIDPKSYIENPSKCAPPETTVFSDWTVIGTEGLVKGVVESTDRGIRVQLFLLDATKQSVVLGKEYQGDASKAQDIAHRFANEIMRFFTGEYGPFGSKIAFSSRVGRFKELFVMDMDGTNIQQLTNDRGLNMSSAWDPAGGLLAFTSYRNRVPDLFLMDLGTRRITQVTRTPGLDIGAAFSRDGRSLLASTTEGSGSQIVLMDLQGRIASRLTPASGVINVSPYWSPDGGKIAFCSNRAGGPQIYTMNYDGSGAKRLSFVTSNYCTSPSWSPKGDKIAFVCRAEGGFNIFVSRADGSEPLQLTSSGNNEDPDWSPDGRYIVFSSTQGRNGVSNISIMREDGSGVRQLTESRAGDSEPVWGPRPIAAP